MNSNFMDLDGANGSYENEALRNAANHYTFLDSLETVFEQNWGAYGAFRPHRYLPVRYISKQDQEGYVLHHGQIVSMINQKNGDGSWNTDSGIDANGKYKTGPGIDGNALEHDIRGPYGYDRTLDGVLVPTNGTTADVTDRVTAADVQIGSVIPATGISATSSDVNNTTKLVRKPSVPFGVVPQIMRETEGQNLSYRPNLEAISPVIKGVLHIPYIIMDTDRIEAANYSDVGYAAVADIHQFLLVANPADLKPHVKPFVDGYGHLIIPAAADASDYAHTFGQVFSFTNETFNPLMAYNDANPLMEAQGTSSTGGLTRRLFNLIKSIRQARGQSVKIADIVSDVENGNYGMVKIPFHTMPIAY